VVVRVLWGLQGPALGAAGAAHAASRVAFAAVPAMPVCAGWQEYVEGRRALT